MQFYRDWIKHVSPCRLLPPLVFTSLSALICCLPLPLLKRIFKDPHEVSFLSDISVYIFLNFSPRLNFRATAYNKNGILQQNSRQKHGLMVQKHKNHWKLRIYLFFLNDNSIVCLNILMVAGAEHKVWNEVFFVKAEQ